MDSVFGETVFAEQQFGGEGGEAPEGEVRLFPTLSSGERSLPTLSGLEREV